MPLYDAFTREFGAKGLPRSLSKLLSTLFAGAPDSAAPAREYVTYTVLYDATALAAPTVQEVCVAPFDAEVFRVDSIVNTAVNADTAVTIEIDGGSALDTLQTGTTKGTVDSYSPGGVITATSDGTAASGDVLICVTLRSRAS
jgi:hypothetical protein